jgi:sugar phosphate isomerase/epimerase
MAPPVIGAALRVDQLADHRDWLLEKPRDLELQSFHSAALLAGDWQPLVDEAKRLLNGHSGRLGIHGPFMGLGIASPDPDIRAIVARRMDQGLDVCAALGATQMVIHSPFTTWGHNNSDDKPGAREAIFANAQETLGGTVRRAEALGVTLVVENIEDKDPADRLRLAQSFGSTAVRVSLDTGHAHYAHGSTGAPPVDYYVHAAGEMLEHIHLQDADGFADRHWTLGEGTIRWHAVFRAIAALQVKPRLILELRDKAGIPSSMTLLESLGLGQ